MRKGTHTKKKAKVWTKTTFRLPRTTTIRRSPLAIRRAAPQMSTNDMYSIVKHPLSSESAIKTIEDQNTLVFLVDKRATKPSIRKACADLYGIKVKKVNTLIRPDGYKKAYVKLQSGQDALEYASKIGIM